MCENIQANKEPGYLCLPISVRMQAWHPLPWQPIVAYMSQVSLTTASFLIILLWHHYRHFLRVKKWLDVPSSFLHTDLKNSLQWTFAREDCGQRDKLLDTLWLWWDKMFLHFVFLILICFVILCWFSLLLWLLFVYVLFEGRKGCKGKGSMWGGGEWVRLDTWYESQKESIIFFKENVIAQR